MEVAQEAQNREAFLQAVDNTLERRLFYIPSFKIYRGVAGLYDYGSPGCAVKSNVLTFWRQVSHNEEDENIRLQMSLYLLQKTLPLIRHIQVERTLELDVGAHIQGVQFTEEDLPKAILD